MIAFQLSDDWCKLNEKYFLSTEIKFKILSFIFNAIILNINIYLYLKKKIKSIKDYQSWRI